VNGESRNRARHHGGPSTYLLRLAVSHRGLERIQLGANGSSPVQQIDDVAELYGRQDADYLLTFLSRGGAVQG
jgi:hypothetical protein